MRELTFVGLSPDGRYLLLVAPDASEYSLRVDERLANALRRESDRLRGQPVDLGPISANPSPREIQDRIRAGMSVGAIAAAAGVSEAAISRFATAVLAERAFVAERAQVALVRFRDASVALGTALAERLQGAGVDPAQLRWDSWRRAEGEWTVICAYPFDKGERVATFVYDPTSRRVAPDDDDARWLVERPTDQATGSDSSTASSSPSSYLEPTVTLSGPTSTPAPASSNQPRAWDPNHPATRAHQRRERRLADQQTSATSKPVVRPALAPAAGELAVGPPVSSDTSSASPISDRKATRWENLLLGPAGDPNEGNTSG